MAQGQGAQGSGNLGPCPRRHGVGELGVEVTNQFWLDSRGDYGVVCRGQETDEDAGRACHSSHEYRLWAETVEVATLGQSLAVLR